MCMSGTVFCFYTIEENFGLVSDILECFHTYFVRSRLQDFSVWSKPTIWVWNLSRTKQPHVKQVVLGQNKMNHGSLHFLYENIFFFWVVWTWWCGLITGSSGKLSSEPEKRKHHHKTKWAAVAHGERMKRLKTKQTVVQFDPDQDHIFLLDQVFFFAYLVLTVAWAGFHTCNFGLDQTEKSESLDQTS